MQLTIIKDDNAVLVDGERHTVDCSGLPADFHALQWVAGLGEIEYSATRCTHCGARSKKGNALITDLAPYQAYVDAWQRAADEAKAEAARKAAEAAQRAADEAEAARKAADAAGPQG